MLQKIIDIEQNRLKALGYDSIVTPVHIDVVDSLQMHIIGNDSYILSGVRVSKENLAQEMHEVVIVSPTESIHETQQELATFGTSMKKIFKNHIVIKTTDYREFSGDAPITPYRLDFIKISPIKK